MRRGDTKSAAYVTAAAAWAERLIAGAVDAEAPAGTELVDELAARFGLDTAARRALDLALGVETSLDAAAALGATWRALAAPSAATRLVKPIVFINPGALLPARAPEGFVLRAIQFVAAEVPVFESPMEPEDAAAVEP